MRRFASQPLKPTDDGFITPADGTVPPVPRGFRWSDGTFVVSAVLRTWRSLKNDRGDAYLKRHWFELALEGGGKIEVYYDREARTGSSRWWLYTIDE